MQTVESEESIDETEISKHKANEVYQRHGWKVSLGDILSHNAPMKKSVQIGKEINLANKEYHFKNLKTPKIEVYESFIPSDGEHEIEA